MTIKPQDILADNENFATLNQVTIRKGTIAALIGNAEIITSMLSSTAEKEAATKTLISLWAQIKQTSFTKHLKWKNPRINEILGEPGNDKY